MYDSSIFSSHGMTGTAPLPRLPLGSPTLFLHMLLRTVSTPVVDVVEENLIARFVEVDAKQAASGAQHCE
jgi:hypothetical protein